MPGCYSKPCGSACGRTCGRAVLTNTQSVSLGGFATTPIHVYSAITGGTNLNSSGEVFSLACDAVVTLTFAGTLYGTVDLDPTTVVSVGLNVQNAVALGVNVLSESYPPSAGLTETSVVPITAVLTAVLTPGTYAAYVNLVASLDNTPINITGVLSITSVKRFA